MAEVRPIHAGQRVLCCGHCGQPLIGYMVPGGLSFQQQSLSLEGGQPWISRGLSTSDFSQSGESGLSGEIA